jgi:hypothetical protein
MMAEITCMPGVELIVYIFLPDIVIYFPDDLLILPSKSTSVAGQNYGVAEGPYVHAQRI